MRRVGLTLGPCRPQRQTAVCRLWTEFMMTQTNNRLFDDLAKLATDAAAVAQGARREVETAARSQLERVLAEANVVPRDEFEAVKAIAMRAADEAELLRARVEALEAKAGIAPPDKPAGGAPEHAPTDGADA